MTTELRKALMPQLFIEGLRITKKQQSPANYPVVSLGGVNS